MSDVMAPSVFRGPTAVFFGSGTRALIGDLIAEFGSRVLFCVDAWIADSPLMSDLHAQFHRVDAVVTRTIRCDPDFDGEVLHNHVRQASGSMPDVILAVGGGSTIDTAKLLSLLLRHGGRIDDYYGEMAVPGPCIGVIAVPTTAGTGSEVTSVAVLTDKARRSKVGVSDPHLIPKVAICDPDLTITAPPTVTAHSGIDAVAHAIESFTAQPRATSARDLRAEVFVGRNLLSEIHSLEALSQLAQHLVGATRNGDSVIHRQGCLLGSLQAGLAFAQTGTGAVHALQYPVGALTNTPHGLGVGVLLPYVMTFNLPAATDRFAIIARTVGVADVGDSDYEAARQAIDWATNLVADIGIPTSLADIGVAMKHLPAIARAASGIERLLKNNARPADEQALVTILESAWFGERSRLEALNHA